MSSGLWDRALAQQLNGSSALKRDDFTDVRAGRVHRPLAQRIGSLHGVLLIATLATILPACHRHREPDVGLPAPEPRCRTELAVDAEPTHVIRWILASDAEDRQALDRWCANVGPAIVHRVAGPNADGVNSIAVVTWNTHVGGGDLIAFVEDLTAGVWTRGEPVSHFVLLLQEVYRSGAGVPRNGTGPTPARIEKAPPDGERLDIVAVAARLGLALYYVPSMANGLAAESASAEDRGNAILSNLPLYDLTAIELPYEAQRRVAVAATLTGTTTAGDAWRLRVVNAHLDSRSRWERFGASLGAGRLRQARALVGALDIASPLVLGGDLNTWSVPLLEGTVPFLREHFPRFLPAAAQTTFSTPWGGEWQLDHLMFRLPEEYGVDGRRVDLRYGSDHHAVLGRVDLDAPD